MFFTVWPNGKVITNIPSPGGWSFSTLEEELGSRRIESWIEKSLSIFCIHHNLHVYAELTFSWRVAELQYTFLSEETRMQMSDG